HDGEGGEDDPERGPDHDVALEGHPDRVDVEVPLDVQRGENGHHDLPDQLVPGPDPVTGAHVQVVVERPQGGHAEQRPQGRIGVRRIGTDGTQQDGHGGDDEDDQDPGPGRGAFLEVVALGTVRADVLAEADLAGKPDVWGHQDHDEQESDQQPLDQLDRPDRHRSSSIRRSSTSRSNPIPLDALTRTTSPGARRGRRASSAAWRSATATTRPAGLPAARAARPIGSARRPTTISRATTPAARPPTSRWPASGPAPSSSISPRTATRRPGRPARTARAAAIDAGAAL